MQLVGSWNCSKLGRSHLANFPWIFLEHLDLHLGEHLRLTDHLEKVLPTRYDTTWKRSYDALFESIWRITPRSWIENGVTTHVINGIARDLYSMIFEPVTRWDGPTTGSFNFRSHSSALGCRTHVLWNRGSMSLQRSALPRYPLCTNSWLSDSATACRHRNWMTIRHVEVAGTFLLL